MNIIAVFNTPGMTKDQYDQCVQKLESAGLGSPDGRVSHVCGINDGKCFVADVWESEEKFGKFGETLIPILQSLGVPASEPEIIPFHHSINR